MKSIINWHKTSEGLPQPTKYEKEFNGKLLKYEVEEPLLVIWNGKVKPSRYFPKLDTWEGHTKEQVPEYWIMLKEIEILQEAVTISKMETVKKD